MTPEKSESEELKKSRDTAAFLDKAIKEILEEYSFSSTPISFPAPVLFENGGSLDSLSKQAAANCVIKGARIGEILIAVSPDSTMPIFKIGVVSPVGHPEEGLVMALFPSNFRIRCVNDGLNPRRVIADAISQIVYHDAKLATEKAQKKRISLGSPEGESLVRVFRGSMPK